MASLNGIVSECLRGSVEAFLTLDREMRPRLVGSLQKWGATPSQAEDIAADVLGECSLPGEKSLLTRFNDNREFEGWLLRVGINRLIDRQRRQGSNQPLYPDQKAAQEDLSVEVQPDPMLVHIVRKALVESFASCDPQTRVLLWLTYAFNIKQGRLAKAWGWSESKLSRALSAGRDMVREKTLEAIQQREPGLTVAWEDIVKACGDGQESLFVS